MKNNFDLKKFLVENKLTPASQKNENVDWLHNDYGPTNANTGDGPIRLKVGDYITSDMLRDPENAPFSPYGMEILSFSNDGQGDTVRFKRTQKKRTLTGDKLVSDTFEDMVSNWEKIYLKPDIRMTAQTEMDFDYPVNEEDEELDEYFSFNDKSPEGQRAKNKPSDVLGRRGQGQITPDNKDAYKNVVGKKGDMGKYYGNVGPKGSLPEGGNAFTGY